MKEMMKKKMAMSMLQKLQGIDPASIEAVTISLVLKGAPMGSKMKPEMEEEEEEMESESEEDEDDESEDELS